MVEVYLFLYGLLFVKTSLFWVKIQESVSNMGIINQEVALLLLSIMKQDTVRNDNILVRKIHGIEGGLFHVLWGHGSSTFSSSDLKGNFTQITLAK